MSTHIATASDSPPRQHDLGAVVCAVVPCLDEEEAIANVVKTILSQGVREVIVVDGGSHDRTVERANAAGAFVVTELRPGYGRAIQTGVAAACPEARILLFVDGDGSDPVDRIPALIGPIADGRTVFVSGSRLRGPRQPGSLSPQQIVAGYVGGLLLRLLYGVRFTDLSPFRAIRRDIFQQLGMADMTYGWNLEMLMRVAAAGLPALEVPVGQRRRVGGVSKVSGNFITGIKAAWTITATFIGLAMSLRREKRL